ncbi:Crp/Fnr family transcriptional regulator [Brevibacillus sp. 7WMA2]|uniref:Anaerobic regulatory protein n=1 Tax=Brevibacillus laterosporus LMG 15441 TaxID=1042163 RepID=A0A075QYT9_BRELA|nr:MULTISPECIES: Crp/Fnr family transcriptional regulator [Brevibacillus]HAS00391.1 Crp/Fnr family transcriptional regulator [Brevibacillus sp.]AIG24744.1 anaerobic regulatory protein [Brevibacillus laterosporus LMG 15441]AUM63395.1 Crp/Fnr family transcriptional regulator [Brevibacillus laterosporus]AYK06403.1 Crp/Fnr family transcriptional regulator [Brevibacillus laterosporus]ERM18079.1 transcriptional regulator [Brevibacillus laterosporus PE36]
MPVETKTFVDQISRAFWEDMKRMSTLVESIPGKPLFFDGDPADYVYLVESGKVRLSKTSTDGKELTLQVYNPGELFGLFGLFNSSLCYSATAVVLQPGELRVISRASLEELLTANGAYCVEFLRWMSLENRRMQSKFRDLLLNGKTGALYSTLIRMCNTYGRQLPNGILIDLSLTNKDLAQFIGLTRESVNRLLGDLKKLDVIEPLPNGYILVKDIHYLREKICCDDCPPDICRL